MGGTSIPQPSQLYLDAADTLYLQPRGFDGTLQSLFTPEDISPTSETRGEQILDATILQDFDSGDVDAQNPVVVFGYSQSASISTEVMRELAGQGRATETQMIDSTHIKAHRSAAGGKRGSTNRLLAARAEGATRRSTHSQMLRGA